MTTIKRSAFVCKQFRIEQDHCAMKVNTDSLVLGSWAAPVAADRPILDIGTGSGILSLMMAQKSKSASVDAIEIDRNAVEQASKNFAASKWADRLNSIHSDLANFDPPCRYATIVTNPPYFEGTNVPTNAFRQQSKARMLARDDNSLSPNVLFAWVAKYLVFEGAFYCLYPSQREAEVIAIAESEKLSCTHLLSVKHTHDSPAHVVAMKFCQSEKMSKEYLIDRQTLTIRNEQQQYSHEFKSLCKDFYLHF